MIPTSPVNPRALLPLLAALLLLAAGPLAPADAASASVSITMSATVSQSFSTTVTGTVSVTNTMTVSPSDTNSLSPSFSTSLTNSVSPSFSISLTNSVSPSFSASVPNSMSATKSIGATPAGTPAPNHVPGVASYGLPVTASPTPGLGSKGTKFALCGNGVKNKGEKCEYMISATKRNPCCTPTCQFRNPLHICGKAPTCYKPPRCGGAGVCDPPVQEVYKAACKMPDGTKGACIKGVCNPKIQPRTKKMLRRLLERRLRKMRNQDLAARGLLPQQEQEEYEGDEEFSAEEEFLADLNNSTDWQ